MDFEDNEHTSKSNRLVQIFRSLASGRFKKVNKKFKLSDKLIIFLIAICVRSILGFIFFGSIDISVSVRDSLKVAGGGILDNLPYFPGLHFIWWFEAFANVATPLPMLFCYKIVNIICDSLIAVLIFDIVKKRNGKIAYCFGILYALSPVAILINVFHGQYDSISLFFLILAYYIRDYFQHSKRKYIIYGVLFGLSFIIKPITLIFLPFFFEPFPKIDRKVILRYISNQALSFGGLLLITTASFSVFRLIGYDVQAMVAGVMKYSKSGITFFGLPHAKEFISYAILQNRFWIMGVILLFALLYYFRKIDIFEAILLSFAFTLGVANMLPNYLIWIVPFLLITNHLRLSALIHFIFTSFLLLWYMNPYTPVIKAESMATFATLNGFKWLMPPTLFIDEALVPFLFFIGNYVIPFCSLLIVLHVLIITIIRIIRRVNIGSYNYQKRSTEKLSLLRNGYINFVFYFWFLLLTTYFTVNVFFSRSSFYKGLQQAISVKFQTYNLHQVLPYLCTGNYEPLSIYNFFNIVFILFFGTIIWSICSCYVSMNMLLYNYRGKT